MQIVAADGVDWGIVEYLESDIDLLNDISRVGVHYPGTSPIFARELGKNLWASEDYCMEPSSIGGGCWARIINTNYVRICVISHALIHRPRLKGT